MLIVKSIEEKPGIIKISAKSEGLKESKTQINSMIDL